MKKTLIPHYKLIQAQMSWIILEYNLVHYNNQDQLGYFIHSDWIQIRSISNEEYDNKVLEYVCLSTELGLEPSAISDVTFDIKKSSRKLVLDKLSQPISVNKLPTNWPNDFQLYQTLKEKLQEAKNIIPKRKNKNSKMTG